MRSAQQPWTIGVWRIDRSLGKPISLRPDEKKRAGTAKKKKNPHLQCSTDTNSFTAEGT